MPTSSGDFGFWVCPQSWSFWDKVYLVKTIDDLASIAFRYLGRYFYLEDTVKIISSLNFFWEVLVCSTCYICLLEQTLFFKCKSLWYYCLMNKWLTILPQRRPKWNSTYAVFHRGSESRYRTPDRQGIYGWQYMLKLRSRWLQLFS